MLTYAFTNVVNWGDIDSFWRHITLIAFRENPLLSCQGFLDRLMLATDIHMHAADYRRIA